jgi:hypothetical protein
MEVKEYYFTNNVLSIYETHYNQIKPIQLVLHMMSQNNHNILHDVLSMKKGIKNATMNMKIGNGYIFKWSLLFLLSYSDYSIRENKVYLQLPYTFMYEIIPILPYNQVKCAIQNAHELSLFVDSYSLISEYSYKHNTFESCIIQEIHSFYIKNDMYHIMEISESLECFTNKKSKGFFIECEVDDVLELTFFINDQERIIYETGEIRDHCKRISPHMIYVPMDKKKSFHLSTSKGTMNTQAPILYVTFSTPQRYVGIHNLSINQLKYIEGSIQLHTYSNFFLCWKKEFQPIIHKKITKEEDDECCITHETIGENKTFMECSHCKKKYMELSIQSWLHLRKTCPTCRNEWIDFRVFINL